MLFHFISVVQLFLLAFPKLQLLLKLYIKHFFLFHLTIFDMPALMRVPHCEPLHPSLQPSSQTPVKRLQDPFPLQYVLHLCTQSIPKYPCEHAVINKLLKNKMQNISFNIHCIEKLVKLFTV